MWTRLELSIRGNETDTHWFKQTASLVRRRNLSLFLWQFKQLLITGSLASFRRKTAWKGKMRFRNTGSDGKLKGEITLWCWLQALELGWLWENSDGSWKSAGLITPCRVEVLLLPDNTLWLVQSAVDAAAAFYSAVAMMDLTIVFWMDTVYWPFAQCLAFSILILIDHSL